MPRCKKLNLSVPWPLWDALEKHAQKFGYADGKRMLVWSVLYSFTVNHKHSATGPISDMPPDVQDMIVREIVADYEAGHYGHESFFGKVLQEVIQQLRVPVSPDVLAKILAAAFARRPRSERDGEML